MNPKTIIFGAVILLVVALYLGWFNPAMAIGPIPWNADTYTTIKQVSEDSQKITLLHLDQNPPR